MVIRELRIDPSLLLELLKQAALVPGDMESDAHITDVALGHGRTATHRDRPPTIVLQIESRDFSPEELLPTSFER